jgi:hypothetical protein
VSTEVKSTRVDYMLSPRHGIHLPLSVRKLSGRPAAISKRFPRRVRGHEKRNGVISGRTSTSSLRHP